MVAVSPHFINNNPIGETDTVIIVPTYDDHLMFLKNVLQQYKFTGKYVICAYDRHNKTPSSDVLDIPDAWVWKHKTYGANKRNGWLYNIIYAAGIVQSFQNVKYVVLGNGDCIWDKPEGIDILIDMLDGKDIISASCEVNLIHTCNMIWSRVCFLTFVEEIKNVIKNNIPESYSPEVLLRDFIKNNPIFSNIIVSKQPIYPKGHFYADKVDHYSAYNQDSTFKDIVGYRNLGGELKTICQEHLKPIPKKYFDLRENGKYFNKHEQETLYQYYITGDYRYLYMYFDQGEDSSFNRRYLALEYYGNKPLYDDSKRKEFGPYSERTGFFSRWKYNSYIIKDSEYEEKWKKIIKERGYDKW